jgi:hypothetical protein
VIELLHDFGWQGREVAVENARQREPHLSNQTARDFKASRLPGARKLTEGRIMRPCNAWTFRRVSSIDSRFCISQRIQLEAQSISLYNCEGPRSCVRGAVADLQIHVTIRRRSLCRSGSRCALRCRDI